MSATVSSTTEIIGASGSENAQGVNFSRFYIVVLSAYDSAGADIALSSTSLPSIGDAWPNVVAGRRTPKCTERTVRVHEGSRKHWLVECKYGNSQDAINQSSGNSNLPKGKMQETGDPETSPWLKSHLYTFSPAPVELALTRDAVTDGAIVNTAGDTFDPPPSTTVYNLLLTINRASQSFNPTVAADLLGSTNSASINIDGTNYQSNRLLLTNWTAGKAYWTDIAGSTTSYWEETIEVLIDAINDSDFHKLHLASVGYNQLSGGNRIAITTDPDSNKQTTRLTTPSPLDDDGAATIGSPYICKFSAYPSKSWSAIGTL